MKKFGRFRLEEDEKIFILPEGLYSCYTCKKTLKRNRDVFVCELDKTLYCMCHRERGSKLCHNYNLSSEHTDILCNLRIEKK